MKSLKYYLGLQYKVEIEYEPIDKSWFAYCPELGKGACYAIGKTQKEALDLLEQEKEDYIKLLYGLSKPIPEPKLTESALPSGKLVIRITKTLHQKIKDQAENEGVSLNQYIGVVLAESVGLKIGIESNANIENTAKQKPIKNNVQQAYPVVL